MLTDQARSGDHIWYVSDVRKFQQHYPQWQYHYDSETILRELIDHIVVREDAVESAVEVERLIVWWRIGTELIG